MIISSLKQKALAVLLLSFCSITAFSQGEIEGGFYGGNFQLGDRGFNEFGAILHVPVGDAVTLNYHFGFGTSLNSGVYVHSTAGMIGGLWILSKLGGSGLEVGHLAFLMCIVPEGVGVYLPSKGNFKTHLSINPLGVEYFYRGATGEEWGKMSCDFVARFKLSTSLKLPVYFAPQVAATVIYTPGETTSRYGFKAGVTIGFEGKD